MKIVWRMLCDFTTVRCYCNIKTRKHNNCRLPLYNGISFLLKEKVNCHGKYKL